MCLATVTYSSLYTAVVVNNVSAKLRDHRRTDNSFVSYDTYHAWALWRLWLLDLQKSSNF